MQSDGHLQALEAALPDSTAGLMDVIRAHINDGADSGFIVVQLLHIAADCVVRVYLNESFHEPAEF